MVLACPVGGYVISVPGDVRPGRQIASLDTEDEAKKEQDQQAQHRDQQGVGPESVSGALTELAKERDAQDHGYVPEHRRDIAADLSYERGGRPALAGALWQACPWQRGHGAFGSARVKTGVGGLVQQEQGREVDQYPDGGVEAFFGQPGPKDTGLL